MKIHLYYVYILTNANHTVLYTGITNDIVRRIFEHKKKIIKGFTFKYNVDKLVYFEVFDFVDLAIAREKQIKGYSRVKKLALINSFQPEADQPLAGNPQWIDLYNNGKIEIPHSASLHSE